jgi:ABC-2 type transport system permease protein
VVMAALAAATVAALGYTSLFLLLGLLVRRALVWGLAYLLIWEQFVARSGSTAARLSILVNARSLLYRLSDFPPPALSPSTGFAAAGPVVVAVAALALTAWALRRVEIS